MRKSCSSYGLFFLFVILVIALSAGSVHADGDTPSKWAITEIEAAIKAGLIPEKIQSEYGSNITREEFSEVAVELYESLSGKQALSKNVTPFTDTRNPKVGIANDLGIVKGVGDGSFAPENAITRQEISVMLYRTLKAAKPEYDLSGTSSHIFADHSEISSWSRDAIGYLYSIEVVNGVGDNLFKPRGNTTREEAIVLVYRLDEKARTAKGGITASRSGTSRRQSVMRSKLEELLAQEMGKPYKWGAEGPNSFDCSGLTYYIFGKLGIALPRVARDQATTGTYVAKDDLEYGDLVFFARDGKNVHHVGIYIGNGSFVHAPQTGDVVKVTTLMSGYYARCYYTAKRFIY